MIDQKTRLAMRKFLYNKKNTKDNYLHLSERLILLALVDNQDGYVISQKQLAKELSLDRSNVSRTLKSLYEKGYLETYKALISFTVFNKTIVSYKPSQYLISIALDWFNNKDKEKDSNQNIDISENLTDPLASDKLEAMKNIKIKNDLWD